MPHESLQPLVQPTDEASLVESQKRKNKHWPPPVSGAPNYITNIYNMGMKLFPRLWKHHFPDWENECRIKQWPGPPSQQFHKADTPSVTAESLAHCSGTEQKHSNYRWWPLSYCCLCFSPSYTHRHMQVNTDTQKHTYRDWFKMAE